MISQRVEDYKKKLFEADENIINLEDESLKMKSLI